MKPDFHQSRQKLKAMNEWLKQNRNILPLYEGYWEKVKQKLKGHYEYYGRSGNYGNDEKIL